MIESDLIPGDVIFFENEYATHNYIDHVAIYVGLNPQGIPLIVHSIISDKGHYYPEKVSGLCTTTLRALRNQLQQEPDGTSISYDVKYKVFRSTDPKISQRALQILLHQARFRIPYDEKRLNEKLAREDIMDEVDFKNLGIAHYRNEGLPRSIKYAARYPSLLTRTRGDGVGRGLTCSMAVILAYQIAELLIENKVRSAGAYEWPSDKYAPLPENNEEYSEQYINYLKKLRINAEQRDEPDLMLGLSFWQDTKASLETYTHKFFAVDAKVIGAAGMFSYMSEHSMWESLGVLEVEPRSFSLNEKKANKEKLRIEYSSALESIHQEVLKNPLLCSPAKSNSPITSDWENENSIQLKR